jgi:hypothetical protein
MYTGNIIGTLIDDEYRQVFGPQTFLEYMVDNPDKRYDVLERLDNHRDACENSGDTVFISLGQ